MTRQFKSADFFDVEGNPTASFALTTFERSGDDVVASGSLTIRGASRLSLVAFFSPTVAAIRLWWARHHSVADREQS